MADDITGNVAQREQAKPGPLMDVNGDPEGTAGLTVDATPRKCGELADGAYVIECPDADIYYLIGDANVLTQTGADPPVVSAFVAGMGVLLPAGARDYFNVDAPNKHIAYVIKSGSSSDGLRINSMDKGR